MKDDKNSTPQNKEAVSPHSNERYGEKTPEFEAILENKLIGILYLVKDRTIWKVNERFTDILGYTNEDLAFQSARKIHIDDEHYHAFSEKHYVDLQVRDVIVEWPFRHKDGHIVQCRITGSAINPDNLNNGILWLFEDISEEQKIRHELLQAKAKAEESDRLKSAFMATMSHELRTPLNAVIGFSDILLNRMQEDPNERLIRIINQSGRNLLEIIESIFFLISIETGKEKIMAAEFSMENLFTDLAHYTEKEIEKSEKQEIELQYTPEGNDRNTIVNSDINKIRQLLKILLNNAVKFTHRGSIQLGYRIEENDLVLFVKDTGVGISKEKQEVIFERFRQGDDTHTRKFEGIGLGLAIAKSISELLHGDLTLESSAGEGSEFHFHLPGIIVQSDPNHKRNKSRPGKKIASREGMKILVAEDKESNFILLQDVLTDQGMEVIRARDGKEAVDIVMKNRDIDLVLMDIKMPVMNGVDATKAIKVINPKLPVIAQTAFAFEGEKEEFMKADFEDYVVKPLDFDLLFEKIQTVLSTGS